MHIYDVYICTFLEKGSLDKSEDGQDSAFDEVFNENALVNLSQVLCRCKKNKLLLRKMFMVVT